MLHGWQKLLKGFPWFIGEDRYPIRAYSEFMPPLRTGFNPSTGQLYPWAFREEDPAGWQVLEMEEEYQLRPGLEEIGKQVMKHIIELGKGTVPPSLAGHKGQNLQNNPYWPPELSDHAGRLAHERYLIFVPVSLSKTKDDKGRVRWTFFGSSEQGPERGFWKSFYQSETQELPEDSFIRFIDRIFSTAYGKTVHSGDHLKKLGFRILPTVEAYPIPYWNIPDLPLWTKKYLVNDGDSFEDVAYLLTFRPFCHLPEKVRELYLAGRLMLLPFPGSLFSWGIPEYIRLQKKLYNAIQIPMLRLVHRNEGPGGIRVPQSGWVHEQGVSGKKADILEDLILNTYIRTNRWDRFHRNDDGLLKSTRIDPVIQTLFSTTLEALDLYNKPMARNCQLLSEHFELLLDGPRAGRKQIGEAALKLFDGGLFRYRFYFPPMQAGVHEVFWHRPLVACLSHHSGETVVIPDELTGYLTAYRAESPDPSEAVELWPHLHRRDLYLSVLHQFETEHDHYQHQTALNLMSLLDAWEVFGQKPLAPHFAQSLIRIPKKETLSQWLESLPSRSLNPAEARRVKTVIHGILEKQEKVFSTASLTYDTTANRLYEESYWNDIYRLSHGKYINKDNADVVQDDPTLNRVIHRQRDLQRLGDYLILRHRKSIQDAGMQDQAEAGELPFRWETDFDFHHYGGWQANQDGAEYERNILVIIPGKNRNEAVIMADHYDTAYMEDVFDTSAGGNGARLSAAGADDNHSATATLLMAAPIFLKLSKEGKLERDIWLLHLTGEEFPSDCMGARNFCQQFIQKTLRMRRADGSLKDLSRVKVNGVFVMDMIAHNRDNARDIFQISPGRNEASLHLARQAHLAAEGWNRSTVRWNESPERTGCKCGQRSTDGKTIPVVALFPVLDGEVRTWDDPHSTLYNTDAMIFSDTGIPVVLFMENYDIHRTGYHDTHDTMENIDLDYGAAVSAIAIESVARVASVHSTIQ